MPVAAPARGASGGALLLAIVAAGGLVGAYLLGRSHGEAADREELLERLGEEQRGARLMGELSEKQGGLIEKLQQLRRLEEQSDTQRVTLADALRESVEMSAALLLLEAREELAPLGRLDMVERAARAALEPYEGRENEALAPSSREVRSAALALLGDVLFTKGQLPEAAEARRGALALARVRLAAQPALAARRSALARAHEALAEALEAGADPTGAWAERGEALKHWMALNDAEPAELAWLGALADAGSRASATLAALGRDAEARAHAEQAVTLARGLRAKEPQDPRWSHTLARALAALALRLPQEGEPLPVEALYTEALQLLEPGGGAGGPGGSGGPGGEVGQPGERADLLYAFGQALSRARRHEDAVARLREALDASVDAVARDPLARVGQERLARVCSALAGALEVHGESDDALRGREEAVSAWKRVSELDPQRTEPRHELLHALLAWGDLLTRLTRLDEALAAFHEGRTLAASLDGPVGAHPASGSDLAECHDRAAATLLALGRRPEALEAWRQALAVIEPLAKKTPENVFWQSDLARIWWHLGQALLASEPDQAEGTRALKRALRLLAPLEASQRLPDYASTWPASLREALGGGGDLPDEGSAPR
jgi:tetratricopeptide (TPR) repeat protein